MAADAAVNRLHIAVRLAIGTLLGRHVYYSTGCLHGRHSYCQNTEGAAGHKAPAVCKFCPARCICRCHRRQRRRSGPAFPAIGRIRIWGLFAAGQMARTRR